MKAKRSTSFGRGNRNSIATASNVPPPGTYDPMESMRKLLPQKACTFGATRDAYKKVYFKHSPISNANTPGPGTYSLFPCVGKEGHAFTLKPKAKNLSMEGMRNNK